MRLVVLALLAFTEINGSLDDGGPITYSTKALAGWLCWLCTKLTRPHTEGATGDERLCQDGAPLADFDSPPPARIDCRA